MSDDLKARLRGAAEYLDISGMTECNPKEVLWEAANALDAKDARIAELERALHIIAQSAEDGAQDQIAQDMWEACRQWASTALTTDHQGNDTTTA